MQTSLRSRLVVDRPRVRVGRINPLIILLLAAVAAAIALSLTLRSISQPPISPTMTPGGGSGKAAAVAPLRLYCAAGMRVPVEKIVEQYKQEYHVPIEIQYGGSNTLLSQLEINQSADADLFLAAEDFYTQQAIARGLAREVMPIARTQPVLIVGVGNPKGIHAFSHLLRSDVRIALADPDQAAVGNVVRERLRKIASGDGTLWQQLADHVTKTGVYKPTVNDVANDVAIGATDAAFVWDSTIAMPAYKGKVESLTLPELAGDPELISIVVLKASKQLPHAYKFARYLTARDKGLPVFGEFNIQPADGDEWDEHPEINFYCGAVNRKVVDQVVEEFMRDEGVLVKTQFNGCGILTSQMRVIEGQNTDQGFPDLYMACDRFYLDGIDDVRGWFSQAAYVSEADLVLAVPKGSDKVHELADLVKPGVRVAIGQPAQCTIGVLTWNMLKAAGLDEQLKAKQTMAGEVVVEKSSSALLVPDVVTGAVDVAVAYVTDTLASRDSIDVLPTKAAGSVAVQTIAIANTSQHKQLTDRLYHRIAEAKDKFEAAGFRYRGIGGPNPFAEGLSPSAKPASSNEKTTAPEAAPTTEASP